MIKKIIVGCVADNSEKYLKQALRLLQSWRWFAGELAGVEFIVCIVDIIPAYYKEQYERYGATIVEVDRFSEYHPPSNKLRFLEIPQVRDREHVILLDCDTIVTEEPKELITDMGLTAKIADVATVTPRVFNRLFSYFKLPMPNAEHHCTVSGEKIIPYFNSGVLAFSNLAMRTLVPEWIRINRILTDSTDMLHDCYNFCDQASLSLAYSSTGSSLSKLDNRYNFPAHFRGELSDSKLAKTDPIIIHYHWLVDKNGMLEPSPYDTVNERIIKFNTRLLQEEHDRLNNSVFWDERYRNNPELGSGIGSRGSCKTYKADILENNIKFLCPASILDVGCGDMEVSSILPETKYVGIDISRTIICDNAIKYPKREFIAGNFLDLDLGNADLVVCLDVIIHIPSFADYNEFIKKCVYLAKQNGIVSGFDAPPSLYYSDITFYHEPLSLTLTNSGARNIRQIGAFRDLTIYLFDAKNTD